MVVESERERDVLEERGTKYDVVGGTWMRSTGESERNTIVKA